MDGKRVARVKVNRTLPAIDPTKTAEAAQLENERPSNSAKETKIAHSD